MLGALGGVLVVSFLIVRDKLFVACLTLLYLLLTTVLHFGVTV